MFGFAGFLLIEELLDAKLKHVKLQDSQLEILIPKSKADQNRDRPFLYLSRTKSACYPVKYLEVYLQKTKLDISNDKESSLICRILKTGHTISKTKGISYCRIRDIFKNYLSEIMTTSKKFGLHCFRSVVALAAVNNRIWDRLISKQGRRSSEKARNDCVNDSAFKRFAV